MGDRILIVDEPPQAGITANEIRRYGFTEIIGDQRGFNLKVDALANRREFPLKLVIAECIVPWVAEADLPEFEIEPPYADPLWDGASMCYDALRKAENQTGCAKQTPVVILSALPYEYILQRMKNRGYGVDEGPQGWQHVCKRTDTPDSDRLDFGPLHEAIQRVLKLQTY